MLSLGRSDAIGRKLLLDMDPSSGWVKSRKGGSMASDDEETGQKSGERRTVRVQPLPLGSLGLGELHDYLAELRAEIARAEAAIARKQTHRSAADAFFRKP